MKERPILFSVTTGQPSKKGQRNRAAVNAGGSLAQNDNRRLKAVRLIEGLAVAPDEATVFLRT